MPNITGEVNSAWTAAFDSGYGCFSVKHITGNPPVEASTYMKSNNKIILDASRSNPIYGSSDTVQPPSLVLLPIIKY